MPENADLVRRLFKIVQEREDPEAYLDCYDPSVEIHEADSLPYGGVWRGREGAVQHAAAFEETWGPFQGPEEHRMDATFYEGDEGRVVAVFRHRAVDRERGERLETPEIGAYDVRDGKVVRSQMFHADPVALTRFLEGASRSA